MKGHHKLYLLCSLSAAILCSFIPNTDKHYADYFLRKTAADLFRSEGFSLVSFRIYYGNRYIDRIDISFTCFKSLTVPESRRLLLHTVDFITEKINNDPVMKDKGLLRDDHFCATHINIDIKPETVFAQYIDSSTGVRDISLKYGKITYKTFKNSPITPSVSHTYKELYKDAVYLVEKSLRHSAGREFENKVEKLVNDAKARKLQRKRDEDQKIKDEQLAQERIALLQEEEERKKLRVFPGIVIWLEKLNILGGTVQSSSFDDVNILSIPPRFVIDTKPEENKKEEQNTDQIQALPPKKEEEIKSEIKPENFGPPKNPKDTTAFEFDEHNLMYGDSYIDDLFARKASEKNSSAIAFTPTEEEYLYDEEWPEEDPDLQREEEDYTEENNANDVAQALLPDVDQSQPSVPDLSSEVSMPDANLVKEEKKGFFKRLSSYFKSKRAKALPPSLLPTPDQTPIDTDDSSQEKPETPPQKKKNFFAKLFSKKQKLEASQANDPVAEPTLQTAEAQITDQNFVTSEESAIDVPKKKNFFAKLFSRKPKQEVAKTEINTSDPVETNVGSIEAIAPNKDSEQPIQKKKNFFAKLFSKKQKLENVQAKNQVSEPTSEHAELQISDLNSVTSEKDSAITAPKKKGFFAKLFSRKPKQEVAKTEINTSEPVETNVGSIEAISPSKDSEQPTQKKKNFFAKLFSKKQKLENAQAKNQVSEPTSEHAELQISDLNSVTSEKDSAITAPKKKSFFAKLFSRKPKQEVAKVEVKTLEPTEANIRNLETQVSDKATIEPTQKKKSFFSKLFAKKQKSETPYVEKKTTEAVKAQITDNKSTISDKDSVITIPKKKGLFAKLFSKKQKQETAEAEVRIIAPVKTKVNDKKAIVSDKYPIEPTQKKKSFFAKLFAKKQKSETPQAEKKTTEAVSSPKKKGFFAKLFSKRPKLEASQRQLTEPVKLQLPEAAIQKKKGFFASLFSRKPKEIKPATALEKDVKVDESVQKKIGFFSKLFSKKSKESQLVVNEQSTEPSTPTKESNSEQNSESVTAPKKKGFFSSLFSRKQKNKEVTSLASTETQAEPIQNRDAQPTNEVQQDNAQPLPEEPTVTEPTPVVIDQNINAATDPVTPPQKKKGFFSSLFSKKQKNKEANSIADAEPQEDSKQNRDVQPQNEIQQDNVQPLPEEPSVTEPTPIVANDQNTNVVTDTVTPPKKKQGFFSSLFSKKQKNKEANSVADAEPQEESKPKVDEQPEVDIQPQETQVVEPIPKAPEHNTVATVNKDKKGFFSSLFSKSQKTKNENLVASTETQNNEIPQSIESTAELKPIIEKKKGFLDSWFSKKQKDTNNKSVLSENNQELTRKEARSSDKIEEFKFMDTELPDPFLSSEHIVFNELKQSEEHIIDSKKQ